MDAYDQLLRCGCILKGHFRLSSGLHTDTYLQCAMLFRYPDISHQVCSALVEIMRHDVDFSALDYVISPAIGGIILGYELSSQLINMGFRIGNLFCEKKEGEFVIKRFGDNLNLNKKKVLVIEDVVTTGRSCLKMAYYLSGLGADIVGIYSIVDRRERKIQTQPLLGEKYPFKSLLSLDCPSFSRENLPDHLRNSSPIYLGSRGGEITDR